MRGNKESLVKAFVANTVLISEKWALVLMIWGTVSNLNNTFYSKRYFRLS